MRRFLAYFGVMDLPENMPPPPATRWVEVRDQSYFVHASERGVYEPLVQLGDQVDAGQSAAHIHLIENRMRPPVTCHFETSGMVACRRAMGRCEPGACSTSRPTCRHLIDRG